MKTLTQPQKDFLLDVLNEWAFKEFILTYEEMGFVRKVFHGSEEYNESGAVLLNSVGEKWVKYHNKEYDHELPSQWQIKQNTLKNYK